MTRSGSYEGGGVIRNRLPAESAPPPKSHPYVTEFGTSATGNISPPEIGKILPKGFLKEIPYVTHLDFLMKLHFGEILAFESAPPPNLL